MRNMPLRRESRPCDRPCKPLKRHINEQTHAPSCTRKISSTMCSCMDVEIQSSPPCCSHYMIVWHYYVPSHSPNQVVPPKASRKSVKFCMRLSSAIQRKPRLHVVNMCKTRQRRHFRA